jgi:hypothetical protein
MLEAHLHNYKFSGSCSLFNMKNALFDYDENFVYTGLRDKYKCLSPNNLTDPLLIKDYPLIEPMKKLIHYQLPGFQYSLTHMCKQRFNTFSQDSYSCYRDRGEKTKCGTIMYCSYDKQCIKTEMMIPDGTECGKNKVCLLNECTHIEMIGLDEEQYHRMSPFHTCSQGFDNSKSYPLLKSIQRGHMEYLPYFGINASTFIWEYMLVDEFRNCEHFLKSKKAIQLNVTCNNDLFDYLCCEECAKFRIIKDKCGLNGCNEEFCNKYKPCFNNGRCVPNRRRNSFDCICPKEYKGGLFFL